MADLPDYISFYRYSVLKAIHALNNKATTTDIARYYKDKGEPELAKKCTSNVYPMTSEKKYVVSKPGQGSRKYYSLTDLGKKMVKAVDAGTVEIARVNSGRKQKSQPKEEQQEIQFEQLNISDSAASLADGLTSVIQENQNYRNLLKQVHNTIGKALGLNSNGTEITEE